jgi:hypothetical protein
MPSDLQMSMENPLWGAPRIHGELLKLGFQVAQSHPAASHGMHPSSKTATMHPSSKTATMHPASKAAAVHATSRATTAAVKGKRRRSNGKRHSKRACGEAFCELVGHPNPSLLSDGSCREVNSRRPQVAYDFK